MKIRHFFLLFAFAVCPAAAAAVGADEPVLPESVEAPPTELLSWAARVDSLVDEMEAGDKTEAEADTLYLELHEVLLERQRQLREVLGRVDSPSDPVAPPAQPAQEATAATVTVRQFDTVRDLYDSLIDLRQVRLRLLELVTPNLHAEITGTDLYGVQELRSELDYVIQIVRFQGLGPEVAPQLMQRLQRAPLPLVWQLLQIIVAIAIFRWWRAWLPDTLVRLRAAMMEIRPRSAAIIRRLKLLWYIDQVRSPLEWLILFVVLAAVFDFQNLRFEEGVIRIVAQWILLGWFTVSLINAVSARGHAGLAGDIAKLRLRTLQLLAAWLVLLGLGLHLTEHLAGAATLYAWVWRLFQVLFFPVLIVLLVWWRPEIFRRLSIEPERTEALERKLRHQTGLRGFRNAVSGGASLVAIGLRRFLLQQVARLGTADIVGSSATRGARIREPASKDEPGSPIGDGTRELLLTGTAPYPRYARAALRSLVARTRDQRREMVGVVGERGGGKSVFLQRLASELEGGVLILECGFGGYAELEQKLAGALGRGTDSVDPGQMSKQVGEMGVRVIAIDNVHRMMRPVIGGQQEADRLADLVKAITHRLLWVVTADGYAVQLAQRMRAGQALADEVIELPPWTPEQIGELIDQRCEQASIAPDFDGLVVPREYFDTTYETEKDRNRAAVYRMIATFSGGNPTVALQLWSDCLRLAEVDGRPVVSLPSQRYDRELETATHEILLMLRVMAQTELISLDDIAGNLRLSTRDVTAGLYLAMSRGWVEKVEDRYCLSWAWFRPVTRLLGRRNMLAR